MEYNIITFDSTHMAIFAENVTKNSNVNARIIPVPSEISSGCGLCLKIDKDITDSILEILYCNNVEIAEVYNIIKRNGKKEVTKIK